MLIFITGKFLSLYLPSSGPCLFVLWCLVWLGLISSVLGIEPRASHTLNTELHTFPAPVFILN